MQNSSIMINPDFTLKLEKNVIQSIWKLPTKKRNIWVNDILKYHLFGKEDLEMEEGFRQKINNADDFEDWETLGFETWN